MISRQTNGKQEGERGRETSFGPSRARGEVQAAARKPQRIRWPSALSRGTAHARNLDQPNPTPEPAELRSASTAPTLLLSFKCKMSTVSWSSFEPLYQRPLLTACPCPQSAAQTALSGTCPVTHHLLTGTFNTLFLYLLAFTPYSNPPSLTITQAVSANGPHQFLALSPDRQHAYATTWKANEPTLSAWDVIDAGRGGIREVNTVPISKFIL